MQEEHDWDGFSQLSSLISRILVINPGHQHPGAKNPGRSQYRHPSHHDALLEVFARSCRKVIKMISFMSRNKFFTVGCSNTADTVGEPEQYVPRKTGVLF
jgi:hypothetical protein